MGCHVSCQVVSLLEILTTNLLISKPLLVTCTLNHRLLKSWCQMLGLFCFKKWKAPDNEVGLCFVSSQNCSLPFCCGGSACGRLQNHSNNQYHRNYHWPLSKLPSSSSSSIISTFGLRSAERMRLSTVPRSEVILKVSLHLAQVLLAGRLLLGVRLIWTYYCEVF